MLKAWHFYIYEKSIDNKFTYITIFIKTKNMEGWIWRLNLTQ